MTGPTEYGGKSYWDAVKRYYKYSPAELRAVITTILVVTFIVAYNDGRSSFQLGPWIGHYLLMLVIVFITVMIHDMGQRLTAIKSGFKPEYNVWWYGLIIGLLFTFITGGKWWVVLPGGIMIHHMATHRLGYFRYGTNVLAFSTIAMMGPVSNVLAATFVKTISLWFTFIPLSEVFVQKFFVVNLAYAAWNMLPVPPLDGSRMMFHSRLVYMFVFGCIAAYAVLVWFGIYSYIFALLIGGFIYILYYIFFERGAWEYI